MITQTGSKILILGLFLLTFISCNEDDKSKANTGNEVSISKEFTTYKAAQKDYSRLLLNISDTSVSHKIIQHYLSKGPYILDSNLNLTNEGSKIVDYLSKPEQFGLPGHLYSVNESLDSTNYSSEQLFRYEYQVLKQFNLLAIDLNQGLLNQHREGLTQLSVKSHYPTLDSLIDTSLTLVENIQNVQPQHREYQLLQKSLAKFVKFNDLSDEVILIPNFRKDSAAAYAKAKEVLIKLNYINDGDSDTTLVNAVKKFQKDNGLTPDGLIGKYTGKMLEFSNLDIYIQAAINLEKWRWIEHWGDHYIFANIPEYMIKIVKDGTLKKENRTVVGTLANKTPEIDSKLSYFIVNPEWYVPYSITTKELIPKMKKDPTYLSRNGYAIQGGTAINSIDWENATPGNFKHKIKQKSGGYNALGKVKFIFKNKHSVYFHDTPSKSFFNRDIRSYSHGCVRVQDPFDIAKYIIDEEEDTYWQENLDSIVKTRLTKRYTPQKEYPIHIGYFSSTGDTLGNLRTFVDIYNHNDSLKGLYMEIWNLEKNSMKVDTTMISQLSPRK